MPTPLTHALVGASLAQIAPGTIPRWRAGMFLGCLAVLPDLDIVTFHLGIRYSDMLGHRGLSHSFGFAFLLALVATPVFLRVHRQRPLQALSFVGVAVLVTLSHGVLDAATNGGHGVGLLLPFDDARYFLPFRPIAVSPFNPASFLTSAGRVLSSEALWVWLPLTIGSSVFQTCRVAMTFLFSREIGGRSDA